MAFWLLLATMLTALVAIYLVWFYFVYVPRYPPGPMPWPVVGNFPIVPSKDIHLWMAKLVDSYGPVYTLYLPRANVVLATLDTIKEAFIVNPDLFKTHEHTPVIKLLKAIPNGGIVLSNGESWKEQRRMAMRILHDFGMGRPLMEQKVMQSVEVMLEELEALGEAGRQRVDMFPPLQMCVANVINNLLFGNVYHWNEASDLMKWIHIVDRFLCDFISNDAMIYAAWPFLTHVPFINNTYKRMEKEYHQEYLGHIREKVETLRSEFNPRNTHEPNTFVEAYLAEMEKGTNPHLTIGQLHSLAADIWLTGSDTTTTALRWAILYLVAYPEVQRKAREEVDRVVGRDRFPNMTDKPLMPYMNAIAHEAQRYPGLLVLNFRLVAEAVSIGGHQLPANTKYIMLLSNAYAANPPFEEPTKFKPERWLAADGTGLRQDLLANFIAFGIGRRQCIGESLARIELFLVLTGLLQLYELHPLEEELPLDLEPVYGEVFYPKKYHCRLVKRK